MTRFYRTLLRLYPASFRQEYGGEMAAIFERRLRDAKGRGSRLAVAARATADAVPSALRVQADLLGQDLFFAVRKLRRSPGFAATAILVAALGIGATTASFSLLDHVLVRPLPYPDSDRLVNLWQDHASLGYSRNEVSPPNYRDWKAASRSFRQMAAYATVSADVSGGGAPERLNGIAATGELFDVLRVRAALGRVPTAADARPGAPAVLVLSHGLWTRRFAADPRVLGRTVLLDDAPYEVVGVMPRGFLFPDRQAEFWRPLPFVGDDFEDRTNYYLRVIGRLAPGVSLAQARAEMSVIARRLEKAYPKANARVGVSVTRAADQVAPEGRTLLVVLCVAAGAVLAIACTNLASLLVARALARRGELGLRAALGAGRERLVRQLLTENLLLAAIGGLVGIGVAAALLPLAARLVPAALPIAETPPLDGRLLLFAALATLATGLGFGIAPAWKACRDAQEGALEEDARSGGTGASERLRRGLVFAQVASSVALLALSGLLLRALWRVEQSDPGFRADGVFTARTALPLPRYGRVSARDNFYRTVLADVRALPGVTAAAYVTGLPMVMRGGIWTVGPAGKPEDGTETQSASLRFVTPGYFAALGIGFVRGRDVADSDVTQAPAVAVVSDSFARRAWPNEDPIGKRFRFALADRTVVGVVRDVRVRGLERESEPQVYLPERQVADDSLSFYHPKDLVVRSALPPASLLPELRRIVARADPSVPVSDARPLPEIVASDVAPRRVQARALFAFAAAALLLAATGLHGLLAFAVSRRTREFGVRLALGARPTDILGMVLRQALALCAGGIVCGLVAALAGGRALRALLAGVGPADAPTIAAAVAVSLAATAAGALVPAIRALRVDPAAAIRSS